METTLAWRPWSSVGRCRWTVATTRSSIEPTCVYINGRSSTVRWKLFARPRHFTTYCRYIIFTFYFKNFCFTLWCENSPQIKSVHKSVFSAHSYLKPSKSMSCFTLSPQVFLFLPLHFTPTTSKFLQSNTQSSAVVFPRC